MLALVAFAGALVVRHDAPVTVTAGKTSAAHVRRQVDRVVNLRRVVPRPATEGAVADGLAALRSFAHREPTGRNSTALKLMRTSFIAMPDQDR